MRCRGTFALLAVRSVARRAWPRSPAFVHHLFANRIGGFFGLDVVGSSLVLWIFVFTEGRRLGMHGLPWPIVANLVVGVSLGLPLFLYLRQLHLDRTTI